MKKILVVIAIVILATTMGICVNAQNTKIKALTNEVESSNIILVSYKSLELKTLKEETIKIKKQKETEEVIIEKEELSKYDEKRRVLVSRGISEPCKAITAIVTAYAPYDNKSGICNDGSPDTTSTGTKPKIGTLAADPKRIPYGTKIYIEGYGYGIVEDTGGALRSDKENIRIDVFMETYEEAINWGKKEMIIYIIE